MLAYKAFNNCLQATMGRGTFQFEPGKTYIESECKCAHNGFHCAENPLDVLDYYDNTDTRFFIVNAEGDINQDGKGSRISCTRLTLMTEITRIQLAVRACMYVEQYPDREIESRYMEREKGQCRSEGNFIIVRGKHPEAAGMKGAWLFLMQEGRNSEKITGIYPIRIDGQQYKEDTWYGVRRGQICKKKRSES